VSRAIIELARSAIDGRFDVDPLECSDTCPFRPVCRYEKRARESRGDG
jgi:ATP-dependent helicase/DNAse subunit B